MIARTTTIGLLVSAIYFFVICIRDKNYDMLYYAIFNAAIFITIMVIIYNFDASFRHNIRFGFEGFFSLIEKGHWETHSNDILKNMYVLPDNAKTWLIGDGYFDNPTADPYYIGYRWKGFYHGTDVGYLRFIFYFGIFGLLAFMAYMWKTAQACMRRFGEHRILFALVLMMNYIVWFKVSSDLFLFFALFLCLPAEEESTQPVQAAQNSN